MRGSQLIGRSLITRHRGQKHSRCVKPSAANSLIVACNGSIHLPPIFRGSNLAALNAAIVGRVGVPLGHAVHQAQKKPRNADTQPGQECIRPISADLTFDAQLGSLRTLRKKKPCAYYPPGLDGPIFSRPKRASGLPQPHRTRPKKKPRRERGWELSLSQEPRSRGAYAAA